MEASHDTARLRRDMTFFPAGFDPRTDLVGALELVEIDTADGIVRLMTGIDGRFSDRDLVVVLLGRKQLRQANGGSVRGQFGRR